MGWLAVFCVACERANERACDLYVGRFFLWLLHSFVCFCVQERRQDRGFRRVQKGIVTCDWLDGWMDLGVVVFNKPDRIWKKKRRERREREIENACKMLYVG